MVALMKTKESQQMGWDFIRSGGTFMLPEERCKIICFGQDSALSNIKVLCKDVKVK